LRQRITLLRCWWKGGHHWGKEKRGSTILPPNRGEKGGSNCGSIVSVLKEKGGNGTAFALWEISTEKKGGKEKGQDAAIQDSPYNVAVAKNPG